MSFAYNIISSMLLTGDLITDVGLGMPVASMIVHVESSVLAPSSCLP